MRGTVDASQLTPLKKQNKNASKIFSGLSIVGLSGNVKIGLAVLGLITKPRTDIYTNPYFFTVCIAKKSQTDHQIYGWES